MKFRYLIYLMPLLLFCCKKSQSGSSINNSGNITFTASFDSVFSCYPNSTYLFDFDINVLSGDILNDPLSCSISGLPANVSDTPAILRVAQLQGGIFALNIGNAPVGTDTLHFVIDSKSYGIQSHKLILRIIPRPDYATVLAGTYDSSYDFCTPSIINYSSVVSSVLDTPSEIKISNIKNLGSGFMVRAWITNLVTIPLQSVGGYTIWGSGTYTRDYRPQYSSYYMIAVSDTLVYGLDTQTCTIHLQH